ncbi:hypothetical protein BO80DRAFT_350420, partial [Aspergillus ibericus CBS 121593]
SGTYDHRVWRTGLPVRSAVLKPHAGRLVVGWVTTSESLLLYVFMRSFFIFLVMDKPQSFRPLFFVGAGMPCCGTMSNPLIFVAVPTV